MTKHFLVLTAILCLARLPAHAAPRPYVIGVDGDYAVIDSSIGVVTSTGNIFSELLQDATFYSKHAFLERSHDIGTTYLDPAHDRIFLFTGVRPQQGIEYGSTDGMLVLRLSDRKYINYMKLPSGAFGHDEIIVSYDNQLFFPGGEGMRVYDGKSYKKVHRDITWPYSASYTCFIPGERKVSDKMYGMYYLDKYVKSELDGTMMNDSRESRFQKMKERVTHILGCSNGKALLVERVKKLDETNPPKLIVYDLKNDKEQLRFDFEPLGAPGDWLLSRDGQYALWISEFILSDDTNRNKLLHDGRFVVYDLGSGKKVSYIELPGKTKEEFADYKDYNFKDLSVDGRSIVAYSEPYLYVVDMKTGKVTSRVELPFTPGWYNSIGFVVWP